MINYQHRISQLILLDSESPIVKGKIEGTSINATTRLETYIVYCAKALNELTSAVDKADFSIDLIRSWPKIADTVSNFSLAQQLEFTIENYFIRCVSIYDRALIFANKLLELGVADQSIGHMAIVTNENIIAYQLADPLKDLKRTCADENLERNSIIHHRRYSDEHFDKLSAILKANEISVSAGREPPFDPAEISEATQALLSYKADDFTKHLNSVLAALTELLDVAMAVYTLKRRHHLALEKIPRDA